MGFWDFIAPDLASFREVMRPTLNPSVQVGDRLVPADQFIDAAYLSSGTWSLLGMEWDTTPANWAYAKSFGKPVIAHIVPSLAAYNAAMDAGAAGVQVADVAGVPAVQNWM